MADEWESSAERSIVPYAVFHGQPNGPFGRWGERFDSLGFRNAEAPTQAKPAGEIRICVLGGSTLVTGGRHETTICGQLQRRFHEAGFPQVRVCNFGVISTVSGQELALLIHTVSDFAPDYIIVYDGGNDLWQPHLYDPRPGYPFNFFIWEAAVRSLRVEREKGRINFYNAPFQADIAALRAEVGYPDEGWCTAVRRRYLGNLAKMRHFALGAGIRAAFFLQPTLFTKRVVAPAEAGLRGTEAFTRYMIGQTAALRPEYAAFAAAESVEDRIAAADVTDAFDAVEGPLYQDFIHVIDPGNDVVAGRLFGLLRLSFREFRPA